MMRDAITATTIQIHHPKARSVLDVGCAAGWLAKQPSLSELTRFVGVDISSIAVEKATEHAPPFASFECSPLESFSTSEKFDIIVFNEVLYYLNTSVVLNEVARYERFLSRDGKMIVSLKNDAKSKAIIKTLMSRYKWLEGCLFQIKQRPSWKVVFDPARPAFLVGVLST